MDWWILEKDGSCTVRWTGFFQQQLGNVPCGWTKGTTPSSCFDIRSWVCWSFFSNEHFMHEIGMWQDPIKQFTALPPEFETIERKGEWSEDCLWSTILPILIQSWFWIKLRMGQPDHRDDQGGYSRQQWQSNPWVFEPLLADALASLSFEHVSMYMCTEIHWCLLCIFKRRQVQMWKTAEYKLNFI